MTDVDIVIPILNEAAGVDELVSRLTRTWPGAPLIFLDNVSMERSHARGLRHRVVKHAREMIVAALRHRM